MTESTDISTESIDSCLEPEVLAALVDGGLDETERREATAHLSRCEDCYESFVEVVRITEELALEDLPADERNPEVLVEKSHPDTHREWKPDRNEGSAKGRFTPPTVFRRPRMWAGWGAAATALAAAMLAFFLLRPDPSAEILNSTYWTARFAKSHADSLADRRSAHLVLPQELFLKFRSAEPRSGFQDGAEAIRIGAMAIHLQYLTGVAREPGLAAEVSENLRSRAAEVLEDLRPRVEGPVMGEIDSVAEILDQGRLPEPEVLAPLMESLDNTFLFSPALELGRWAELARIACAEQDSSFFRDRRVRRVLLGLLEESRAESRTEITIGGLPSGAVEPLERLSELLAGGVTRNDIPQVQQQVEYLLRLP